MPCTYLGVHEKILGMGMPRCITYDVVSKILSFEHQVDLEWQTKISLLQKPFNEVFEICKTRVEKGKKS